jgi:hypothetical protein
MVASPHPATSAKPPRTGPPPHAGHATGCPDAAGPPGHWKTKTRPSVLSSPPRPLSLPFNCPLTSCLERWLPFCRFPHVVARRRAAVPGAWRAARAGLARFWRTGQVGQGRVDVPKPRRTRAGVSRPGGAGRSQGRRTSSASGRARRSWAWAAMMSQVHRSAACGSRIFGVVQPVTCFQNRKVCSRSNRRKNACQHRSTSAGGALVAEDHSQMGLGSRSPGR